MCVCVCYLCTGERSTSEKPTHWWILGLVIGGLLLALAGMMIYVKLRGRMSPGLRLDRSGV